MAYSASIPHLFHHKETQSKGGSCSEIVRVIFHSLLCVSLWWKRCGILVEYVIQLLVKGMVYYMYIH
jgi:hypothetical protein